MKYFEKIDGLRCIAVFFVLIEHFANSLARQFSAGQFGVDLFFVISGFLITSILLRNNNSSLIRNYVNFISRRSLRIFPIYYLVIILLWFLDLPGVREYFIWLLSYTYNYALVSFNIPNTAVIHLWTLAVEEQFYIFWPLLILAFKKKIKILKIVIIIIIVFGFSQMMFNLINSINKFNNVGILTRMSTLALGGLGAVLSSSIKKRKSLFNNVYLEYGVFILLTITLTNDFILKPLLIGVIGLFLVLKSAYFDFKITAINSFLENKIIKEIGVISYGIYLFHLPIDYYFTKYVFDPIWLSLDFTLLGKFEELISEHPGAFKMPMLIILSVCLAKISYVYIEYPILKMKDKYFKY